MKKGKLRSGTAWALVLVLLFGLLGGAATTTQAATKNASDVKAIKAIIKKQINLWANVSEDLNNSKQYEWENGRLVKIKWNDCELDGELDFSKLTALRELDCSTNSWKDYKGMVTRLDVSGCKNLTKLNCSYNRIYKLNVSKNKKLKELDCSRNELTALDVSTNTSLKELNCSYNELTCLYVIRNTKLEKLNCEHNGGLLKLELGENTNLTDLNCEFNCLKKLDVSKNVNLTVLDCGANKLTKLDVSKNSKLAELDCSGNDITVLDVCNCAADIYVCADYGITVIGAENRNHEPNE